MIISKTLTNYVFFNSVMTPSRRYTVRYQSYQPLSMGKWLTPQGESLPLWKNLCQHSLHMANFKPRHRLSEFSPCYSRMTAIAKWYVISEWTKRSKSTSQLHLCPRTIFLTQSDLIQTSKIAMYVSHHATFFNLAAYGKRLEKDRGDCLYSPRTDGNCAPNVVFSYFQLLYHLHLLPSRSWDHYQNVVG